jgi:hypothetical protein
MAQLHRQAMPRFQFVVRLAEEKRLRDRKRLEDAA